MSDRSFLTYLWNRHALALALLAGLTLAAYANSFRAGFTQDNQALILDDPRLRVASSENLGLILHQTYWWPKAESGLYRPITTLSYLLNYSILKNAASAAGYHWINLLLHVINAYLGIFSLLACCARSGLLSSRRRSGLCTPSAPSR
jgi:hypothetical protein